MQTPEFVPKADMFNIHQPQIEMFGGLDGIGDDRLLDSALAQPQATFFGELLHPTISAQAAQEIAAHHAQHGLAKYHNRGKQGNTTQFIHL